MRTTEPAADPGAAEEPEGMPAVDDAPACAEVTTEAGELGDAVLDELQAAKEIVAAAAQHAADQARSVSGEHR